MYHWLARRMRRLFGGTDEWTISSGFWGIDNAHSFVHALLSDPLMAHGSRPSELYDWKWGRVKSGHKE